MSTASERIQLVGLSLEDAYRIAEQLRARSLILRDAACAIRSEGGDATTFEDERWHVLALREKLSAATDQTLAGLG